MNNGFLDALDFVLLWEGGEVNHPADPGGHTNMGVTQRTLDWFRSKYPSAGLPSSVSNLTHEHVQQIYYQEYYRPLRCDEMPEPISLLVFDAAVNQGAYDAGRFLQRAVGAAADGIVGSKTLSALERAVHIYGVQAVAKAVAVERAYDYALNDSIDDVFGRGWYRRLFDCYEKALKS